MDQTGAAQVAASVQAVNDIMETSQQKSMQMSEKLMKVNLETSLGKEPGKGANIDAVA